MLRDCFDAHAATSSSSFAPKEEAAGLVLSDLSEEGGNKEGEVKLGSSQRELSLLQLSIIFPTSQGAGVEARGLIDQGTKLLQLYLSENL